jgi:hypothetical protein
MRWYTVVVLPLLMSVFTAQADPDRSELRDLGKKLAALRTQPPGTTFSGSCPSRPATLVGLPQRELNDLLGKPDDIDRDGSWTYVLSGPRPPLQFGGGFPILSFFFSTSHRVTRVTCYFAK